MNAPANRTIRCEHGFEDGLCQEEGCPHREPPHHRLASARPRNTKLRCRLCGQRKKRSDIQNGQCCPSCQTLRWGPK